MFVYTRYIFAKVIGLPVTDAAMCGSGGVGGSSLATIHTDACMGEGETFEMYYYILGLDVVFIISYLFCFVFIKCREKSGFKNALPWAGSLHILPAKIHKIICPKS